MKNILKSLAVPLIMAALYGLFFVAWRMLHLPPHNEIILILKEYLGEYGLLLLFISALVEGALLLGFYYPGGTVIFLSVILAGKDVIRVSEVVLVASAALLAGYSFDYMAGRYGWYRIFARLGLGNAVEKGRKRVEKHLAKAVVLSYWDPNLASFTATGAGILKIPYGRFALVSILPLLIWNIFWATLIYFVGQAALAFIGPRFIAIVIGTWVIYAVIKLILERMHRKKYLGIV
jgi:membrane protein DedA with SNARE-associated domain